MEQGVTLGVEQKRSAKSGPAPKAKTGVSLPINGQQAAKSILDLVDLATVLRFGPAARFTADERKSIEAPAGRIIERLSPEAAQKLGQVSDPLMLATALGMYALRLATMSNVPRRLPPPPPPPPRSPAPPPPPPPTSGPDRLPTTIDEVDPNGVTPIPEVFLQGIDQDD